MGPPRRLAKSVEHGGGVARFVAEEQATAPIQAAANTPSSGSPVGSIDGHVHPAGLFGRLRGDRRPAGLGGRRPGRERSVTTRRTRRDTEFSGFLHHLSPAAAV